MKIEDIKAEIEKANKQRRINAIIDMIVRMRGSCADGIVSNHINNHARKGK